MEDSENRAERNVHGKNPDKKDHPVENNKNEFQFEGDEETIAMAIMKIQEEIEYYIHPLTRRNWNKQRPCSCLTNRNLV